MENNAFLLKNVLSQGGFFMLNKVLIMSIGLDEAAIVAVLIDMDETFGDWFYATSSTMQKKLNIGRRPYDSALKTLKDKGIVHTQLRGVPAKLYFHIDYNNLFNLLSDSQFVQNEQTSLYKMNKQVCTKRTTNQKHNNKTNNIIKESTKEKELFEGDNAVETIQVSEIDDVEDVEIISDNPYNVDDTDLFEQFWESYDKKVGKINAYKVWVKLSRSDKVRAIAYCIPYKNAQPEKQYRKNPETFLRQHAWNDELVQQNQSSGHENEMENLARRAAESINYSRAQRGESLIQI